MIAEGRRRYAPAIRAAAAALLLCLGPAGADARALSVGGSARAIAMAPYPSSGAIDAAARFLEGRAGATAFAVVDNEGRLHGLRMHEHFRSASVVKVMMLCAYLQRLQAAHRALSGADNALLYPMIHESNNQDASAVLGIVGQPALYRVAAQAGMSDYAPGVGWWAYTQTSAADQAKLFFELERLIPTRFYAYARGLLSGIEPAQSWGIPPAARPTWQVFFKTGALPEEGLFVEGGRLERRSVTFAMAVFSNGAPSEQYGGQSIQGVAEALIAQRPRLRSSAGHSR